MLRNITLSLLKHDTSIKDTIRGKCYQAFLDESILQSILFPPILECVNPALFAGVSFEPCVITHFVDSARMYSFHRLLFASIVVPFTPCSATIIYMDDFSSGTGFTELAAADTQATFGYDYSADGIPSAPNGTGTTGLKLEANITNGTSSEIAVVRALSFSGTAYRVSVDAWTNFSISDSATTEFLGASVGHDGSTAGRSGAALMITGDGGSSRDFRLYKDTAEQFFSSNQYGPTLSSNNGFDPALSAAFPGGVSAPAAQSQIGTTDAGDSAFNWITIQIDVDPLGSIAGTTSDKGTAKFTLLNHSNNQSIDIGTIDNSNGGPVVDMEGNIALVYADLFSSVAGDPDLQFGLYDNLVIETVPEPSSALLAGLASISLLFRRHRFESK